MYRFVLKLILNQYVFIYYHDILMFLKGIKLISMSYLQYPIQYFEFFQ